MTIMEPLNLQVLTDLPDDDECTGCCLSLIHI